MIVMKFGGTSVGSAEMIKNVASIVQAKLKLHPVVVVSAVSGITDMLIAAAKKAEQGAVDIKAIREKHEAIATGFGLEKDLLKELDELEGVLAGIKGRAATLQEIDLVQSFGERISSKIVAAYFSRNSINAKAFNAYDIGMITDESFGKAELLPESYRHIKEHLKEIKEVPVITGFIAKTKKGQITTLGRGGSDYSAAIIGAAIGAEEIQIWTDVNGVMSADPKIVKEAHTISELSFDEAAELAFFGAKVIHPKTILPAVEKKIPVIVLNTMNPTHSGTRIVSKAVRSEEVLKSITCKKNVTVVNIQSFRMLDAFGFLARIFSIFETCKLPVDMIATSEVSVSLTIDRTDSLPCVLPHLEKLGKVQVDSNNAIIMAVGEGLKRSIGAAAPIFQVMADNKINVEMISQGSSEINVGLVVDMDDAEKAVKVLHQHYFE